MKDSAEWPDNLWKDILDFPPVGLTSEPETGNPHYVLYWPNLDDVLKSALDERQQKIIRMRYEQGLSYQVISEEISCSQSRASQIVSYSLRKLREPQYFRRLRAIPESEILRLRRMIHDLTQQQEDFKEQINILFGEVEARKVEKRSQMPLDSHIDELDLSIRSQNCLIAKGIGTVGDLINCTESTLRGFKKLGKVSLAEIKAALAKYDYELRPED